MSDFVLKGHICSSLSPDEIRVIPSGYVVCKNQKSCGMFETLPVEFASLPLHDYGDRLILPGLIDLHIHASQYAYRGIGMDLELMEWLQNQAFPEEIKYADAEYAEYAYTIFAEQMRKSATTRACIFATKHCKATEILMDAMEKSGIISYVGKVNMDREAPAALCEESAEISACETLEWLRHIEGKYKRTKPILTPRFVPCCSDELLGKLQKIQETYHLPVQSHLSENRREIEWVKENCKYAGFYGAVYDRYGLFGKAQNNKEEVKTVMAHCVYSTQEEIAKIKENGVFVAHCPASNMNLFSGIAPVRKYQMEGIKIGLGSDVAGGQTESVFRAMTDAIQVSKLYWRLVDQKFSPITFEEAFYMATKGGGAFFGKVGSFEEGYELDAIIMDDMQLPHPQTLSVRQRLERAAYLSLDIKGIYGKYVAGKKLF